MATYSVVLGALGVALAGAAVLFALQPQAARAVAAKDSPTATRAVASAPAVPTAATSDPAVATVTDAERERATSILDGLSKTYKHLDGVTVTFGTTPDGGQAVAYYTEGQIVVSDTHTVGIEKILAHEIWHVIDWRDNGQMDWGEDLPPSNASDYLL